jgi:FKBP-type peptidyl-prolyl cis-trans isomerase FkpA
MQSLKVMIMMRRTDRYLPLLALLLALATLASAEACRADDFRMTPGGVAYRDLKEGSGAVVKDGDAVTVQLTGWVREQGPGSAAFFDTRREGQPVRFVVGAPKVLPGWNEGVRGMRAGGRRLLKIPPELGLGARSFEDVVPPNATLVFVVELLEVRPATH